MGSSAKAPSTEFGKRITPLSESKLYISQRYATLLDHLRGALNGIDGMLRGLERAALADKDDIAQAGLAVSNRAVSQMSDDAQFAGAISAARQQVEKDQENLKAIVASDFHYEAFLNAEFMLTIQYGVHDTAALLMLQRGWELREAIKQDLLPNAHRIGTSLHEVRKELETELAQQGRERASKRRELIKRAAFVVGGGFLIGLNTFLGSGAAPVTGGLILAGVGVSNALGAALISTGFEPRAERERPTRQFVPNLPFLHNRMLADVVA